MKKRYKIAIETEPNTAAVYIELLVATIGEVVLADPYLLLRKLDPETNRLSPVNKSNRYYFFIIKSSNADISEMEGHILAANRVLRCRIIPLHKSVSR